MRYIDRKATRFGGGMSHSGADGRFELKHAATRALLDYWRSLRAGRDAPDKSEITAEGLGSSLAGCVFILERLEAGELRFRLAGSRLHDLFGLELRGANGPIICEPASRPRFVSVAEDCLDGPDIGLVRGVAADSGTGAPLDVEIAMAPLRGDAPRPDRLIGCAATLGEDGRLAPAPRRLRITETETLAGKRRPSGFAEAPSPFVRDDLRAIEGGGGTEPGERRRGHLRLVKD